MNYEIVRLEEKIIVGVTARTGNTDPNCSAVIGGLWNDYMGKGIDRTIENKVGNFCYGLYSDYDFSDMTYDVTIGAEVSEYDGALSKKLVPAGNYALFRVKGDVVKDVAAAWNEIWQIQLDRSFTADFEEYVSNNNGVAEINIYVALK